MRRSQASTAATFIFFALALTTTSALPSHHSARQGNTGFEDSGTDYTGYTLEGCQDVFDVCKGHLIHPGHVPGGMKQCVYETGELVLPFALRFSPE